MQRRTKNKDSQEEALNKHRPEQNNSHNSEDGELQEEKSRRLKNFFDANGIHSAMDHDTIRGIHESEKVMTHHEASRVAERAALALQLSRRFHSAKNVSVLIWTSCSEFVGALPTVQQRFGSTMNARLVASSSQGQTRFEESGNQRAIGISASASAGSLRKPNSEFAARGIPQASIQFASVIHGLAASHERDSEA
uniref:Uncharacterized protein n=1 Tax=Physcomitrium patens TaxID=3218 RepID=A0A2K1LBE2_PHYPA|nr:hypothetical protein PHYPA_001774 [Physcomitrium patens]